MTHAGYITLDVADTAAAERFYATDLGLSDVVRVRGSDEPAVGFRGFTLSLILRQPSDVDALVRVAVDAGAEVVTPATRSLWGYGGTLLAPDGTTCTVASASKKDRGPATRRVDDVVLQLGVADVAASKAFYRDHGVAVAKSVGRRYAELDTGPVKVTLLRRDALAKAAGVPDDGGRPLGLAVASDVGPFTDPDGFVWESRVA